MKISEFVKKLDVYPELFAFMSKFNTVEEAWRACARGDFMFSIAGMLKVNEKTLILAKLSCAATVQHLIEDKRGIEALEMAKKFIEGDASKQDLKNAADDALRAAAKTSCEGGKAASYAAYAAAYIADDIFPHACACATIAAKSMEASIKEPHNLHVVLVATRKSRCKTASICREILTKEVLEKLEVKQ